MLLLLQAMEWGAPKARLAAPPRKEQTGFTFWPWTSPEETVHLCLPEPNAEPSAVEDLELASE